MYGTVARMHVKPGMLNGLLDWAETRLVLERRIPGHIETLIYRLDSDPDTLIMAVIFDSAESYRMNAASPEQHADYLHMITYLTEEPEWHDGRLIWRGDKGAYRKDMTPGQAERAEAGPPAIDANALAEARKCEYGTIARMRVRPGMRSLFLSWAQYASWTTRVIPGLIQTAVYQMDEDGQEMLLVCEFEDRDTYMQNAISPEQHADYVNMRRFLIADPEWNDGDIVWHM